MEGVAIGFAIVIVLIVMGVPIAMAFGALTYFLIVWFDADPSYLMPTAFIKIRSVVLLAVPCSSCSDTCWIRAAWHAGSLNSSIPSSVTSREDWES